MSATDYYTTAISIGDLKNGMLYFDNLIPTIFPIDFIEEISKKNLDAFKEAFKKVGEEVLPKKFIGNNRFAERFIDLNMFGYDILSKALIKKFNFQKQTSRFTPEQFEKVEETFGENYLDFINEFHLQDLPMVSANTTSLASLIDSEDTPNPAILTLSNLKIIDASNASWEQLVEFRKDPNAKAKLRKLRMFAYENYTGKSKNYVEDDINIKIYDYEKTAKKFGLNLLQATVNNVINSKLFNGVLAGSILTTLFTEQPIGLLTASIGAMIELGHLTLEFKTQKFELQSLLHDNPVSFITYYKEKLGND